MKPLRYVMSLAVCIAAPPIIAHAVIQTILDRTVRAWSSKGAH